MNLVDLTPSVGRAVERRQSWSTTIASVVAWTLTCMEVDVSIGWDGDAGERWIQLLVDGTDVAYLSTRVPMAFVMPNRASWPYPVEVVVAADLAGTRFKCSPGLLAVAFGESAGSAVLDPAGFTAQELWFSTI